MSLPQIIQGGMGVAVSNWRLAQAVSSLGQLGVVSGTGLDQILARRLQDGDPGGHVRRALQHFPLRRKATEILDALYIPGGRTPGTRYRSTGMHSIEAQHWPQTLCIAANFVEVFLAREHHSNPVGINYLEKIQLPHLPSLYGAMLAGVAVVIVGAGVPLAFPGALDALVNHEVATYPVYVSGERSGDEDRMVFDPGAYRDASDELPSSLERPAFLPIVSSVTLATMLCRRAAGQILGFVVELPQAGGHNAPPRGKLTLSADGQPVYGPRDEVDPEAIRKLGLPFWLAGSYGSPEGVRAAVAAGAAGVQVGTAFALCAESGMVADVRRSLIQSALNGEARVMTDPLASPTGFPFKVASLAGTLSDSDVYSQRRRICDLGFLREAFRREDGSIGYRCPAEPEEDYAAKGGQPEDTVGRKCLCNALTANIGMPQQLADGGRERCLITLGDAVDSIRRFCGEGGGDYSAADVVRVLLS
ncbi:nitronate monooxygenase [Verrucomicrobiota bacterium]